MYGQGFSLRVHAEVLPGFFTHLQLTNKRQGIANLCGVENEAETILSWKSQTYDSAQNKTKDNHEKIYQPDSIY